MGPVSRAAIHTAPAANSSKPRKILAIDYGRKRIGLAISDELGLTARPLLIMQRKNRREDMRRLAEIVKKYAVAMVIIGLPLHLDGRRGEMAEEAECFAARIGKETKLPVILRDERLTSWDAEQITKESKSGKRLELDSLAAAIILCEYLEEERPGEKS